MIMHCRKQITAVSLWTILAIAAVGQEAASFQCQMITLPAKAMPSRFIDLGHEGRSDLLAVDTVAKQLLIYRQHAWGFTNIPDQSIQLPTDTAWISPYQLAPEGGCALVVSTATGLAAYRQNGGVFESQPRPLITAAQLFTNDDSPALVLLGTNGPLPVITANEAWLYHRNEESEWTSAPPVALEVKISRWSGYRSAWTMGGNSSHDLYTYQSICPEAADSEDEKPENDAIGKLIADLKKAGPWSQSQEMRVDLNGDGRKDFIIWQVLGELDFKTDIYVFLRGADGKLPEQPTQILHCRGFPIPLGSAQLTAPIGDLKGDGTYELVLLEPRVPVASLNTMLDMALSRGVDMALTIRSFKHGAFARSAEASVPVKSLLSWYGTWQWPFFICGDFNGDGRPDLVVQRSADQWDIFFSTVDGRWFGARPGMEFKMPAEGYFTRRSFEIGDLNGDGRADIVLRDQDDPRIFIFLTPAQTTKGKP